MKPVMAMRQGPVLVLVTGLAIALSLQGTTLAHLGRVWSDQSYQHVWLVLPLLAYVLREFGVRMEARPSGSGLWLAVPAALLWLAGHALGFQVLQHLALVMSLLACVVFALGPAASAQIAGPLGMLLLLVPNGDLLLPALQQLTKLALESYLSLAGYEPQADGYVLSVQGLRYRIEPACAGLQTFNLFMLLGYGFGLLLFRRIWPSVQLAATFAAVAVLGNSVRVCTIVTLDVLHGSKMDLASHGDVQLLVVSALLAVMVLVISHCHPARERHTPDGDGALATR